jgi:hypothetical protein
MSATIATRGLRATLIALVGVLTATALHGYQRPFVWVFGAWCAMCVVEAAAGRSSLRFFFVNAAAVLVVLSGVEYSWTPPTDGASQPREIPTYDPQYAVLDEVLGYAPSPSVRVLSTLTRRGLPVPGPLHR